MFHNCDMKRRFVQMYNISRENNSVRQVIFYSRQIIGIILGHFSVNIFTFVYHDKVKHTIMAVIYPIGIQNFEKLRKDGYLYIDKTAFVHELAMTGSYYFLSRPRRFGKSLLISTLEA